jgi:adenylate kinase
MSKNSKVVALNLNVSDELIFKRIAGRLTANPSAQRSDDNPEVVKERLKVYHEQTEPLVEYYTKKGVLANINGENSPEEVAKELLKKYKELQK